MFGVGKGRFDNRFVGELPVDPDQSVLARQVYGSCWSRVMPTPVQAPELVAFWPEVARLFDLTDSEALPADFAEVLSGNKLLPGMDAYAACYGGHQFGHWAGQLGDGRAIGLGEYVNAAGERWELQLKGAGLTPYSRTADGRAVLRSSMREFLCSEAMFHLGVPTTRALSLVKTGELVLRDMFYDGNPRHEPGAVVCRVAPSFIRFGNFEIFTSRGDVKVLSTLLDFTIARDFPNIKANPTERRKQFFTEVCRRTAALMVAWLRVGFVHGVMNTDNMSILGLTIDYGPYGWIDNYDGEWTPNTTDSGTRRYAFAKQPHVAKWNLACLAHALTPLIPEDDLAEGLQLYDDEFAARSKEMHFKKFGLQPTGERRLSLIKEAYGLLQLSDADMTLFFRRLADIKPESHDLACLDDIFYDRQKKADYKGAWQAWLQSYGALRQEDGREWGVVRRQMNQVNPLYVLRNYLAQEIIDQVEAGATTLLNELMDVLRAPYDEQVGAERFARKRPDWALDKPGCSRLSCSS